MGGWLHRRAREKGVAAGRSCDVNGVMAVKDGVEDGCRMEMSVS